MKTLAQLKETALWLVLLALPVVVALATAAPGTRSG